MELAHSLAAIPFIASKACTTGESDSPPCQQMFHYYNLHRADFLCHYHKWSTVESTFNMIKTKFGKALKSKTEQAQHNELLYKVHCHNICCLIQFIFELRVEVRFPELVAAETA